MTVMGEAALFSREGGTLVPGDAARGPWRKDMLHGAAAAALLSGALRRDEWNLARVAVDILGPIPFRPLTLSATPADGGRRVTRQSVTLLDGDRPVARAAGVSVRMVELDELPADTRDLPTPFTNDAIPTLDASSEGAAEWIGWECFDSMAMAVRRYKGEGLPDGTTGLWLRLLVPVIAGEPNSTIQQVAAAADYGSSSLSSRLSYREWSFMNTDLCLHLVREPVGPWIGLGSLALAESVGVGLGLGTLYDERGRLGQSAQALVVEPR